MKKILVIVGHTGAGKSTVCKRLANFYNKPLLSFASVGKEFSESLGYKRIRECYKNLGARRFKETFSEYFFSKISYFLMKSDFLIIDGLYLDDIAIKLKNMYNTLYVCIDVPEITCVDRVAKRLGISQQEVNYEYRLKEELKENLGNDYIINNADLIVDGTKDRNVVYQEIKKLAVFK